MNTDDECPHLPHQAAVWRSAPGRPRPLSPVPPRNNDSNAVIPNWLGAHRSSPFKITALILLWSVEANATAPSGGGQTRPHVSASDWQEQPRPSSSSPIWYWLEQPPQTTRTST